MTDARRPIEANDINRVRMAADAQISPAGSDVAFVSTSVDGKKNTYRSEIWVAGPGRPARRYTGGAWRDNTPRWSPDGRTIAFLSDRTDEKTQLYLIPIDGGETTALTTLESGAIDDPVWSPDGARIAFVFRATPAERTKKAIEERKESGASSPPRVHRRLFYRVDGFGYIDDSYRQIWVVDVAGGAARPVTEGAFHCASPCWSPDGSRVAFFSDRRPDADTLQDWDDGIWCAHLESGSVSQIPAPLGEKAGLTWSPDSAYLAFTGNPESKDIWGTRNWRVWLLPAAGAQTARDLTGATHCVGRHVLADLADLSGGSALSWSADSTKLYFPVSERGDTTLCSVDIRSSSLARHSPATHVVGSFSLAPAGQIAVCMGSPLAPPEVFYLADPKSAPVKISDINSAWLAEVSVSEPEPFAINHPDHSGTVPGWFLFPNGRRPEKPGPFVIYVHGGPHLQYGNILFHEHQWLAANGYGIAFCNPRGSTGYGEEHTGAIKGDWGGPAFADLDLVADEAVRLGYADPDRMAIMGGSYGGYMSVWAVGHTERFRCAIADRLVANIASMSGTTDFPWSHGTYYQGNAWDDPSDLWTHSPLAYAGRIKTPLLIIHSDGDLRCPVSQAEELFAALRLQRKPVEFVRYPAETSHGMSRTGPPDLRLDRLRRNLAWLDRFLKG